MNATTEVVIVRTLGAIVVVVASIFFSVFSGLFLALLLDGSLLGSTTSRAPGKSHEAAFYLTFVTMALACGALFVVGAWNRQTHDWKRWTLYCAAAAVLLPLSGLNFSHSDTLVPIKLQVVIDLVCSLVGIILIRSLMELRFSAHEATTFRLFAIGALAAFAVAMPLINGTLWILWALTGTKLPAPSGIVTFLASAIGVATAVLDLYRKMPENVT